MALIKKRKIGSDDEPDSELVVEQPQRKKLRYKKGYLMLIEIPPYYDPPESGENMLMKLPAELRNKIYGLVLDEEDNHVYVRAWKNHKGCRHLRNDGIKPRPWQEPGLLRVSRQIRNEASAMYYHHTTLTLFLTTDDFEAAYNWLKQIATRCQTGFGPAVFLAVTTGWSYYPSYLLLTKMFYELECFNSVNNAPRIRDYIRDYGFTNSVKTGYGICAIGRALQDVAKIGYNGANRGLSWGVVKEDFKDWAVAAFVRDAPLKSTDSLAKQLGLDPATLEWK